MKLATALLLLVFISNAYADDAKLNCLLKEYLEYTKLVSTYWDLMDGHFRETEPELYDEFSYLITEQKNNYRALEITIRHLIKNHPEELKLEGNIYNLVSRYRYYGQEIYRELRAIPEFDRIYWENESFKKENKMPDYERLKLASDFVLGIDLPNQLKEIKDIANKKSQAMVSSLPCNS